MTDEADFLVVGAGSAGAVVAGRLAERGAGVTLIEAGPDWRSAACLPELRHPSQEIFAWKTDGRTPAGYAWPQLMARRRPDRDPAPYLRGRGLGGTSTINGLVAIRPPLEEFDDWVSSFGCAGWDAASILPHFVRLEDDLDYGDREYHGEGGPTPVVRPPESGWGSMDDLLAAGAVEVGHAYMPDYNAPGAFGVSRTAMNTRDGDRSSTNDGYLEPLRGGPNLRIVGETTVDRVLFRGNRAVGVRALTGGRFVDLRAATVVLCAGAAGTPALLQRSGVGPAALLRRLGIDVVADLPVGRGIQDHAGFWLAVALHGGHGAANGSRGNCTLRYSSGLPGSGAGDLLMVSANPLRAQPDEGALGVKLAQCFARGTLEIVSADPSASPAIELGLLGDKRDRTLARRALRDALELLAVARRTDRIAVHDRYGTRLSAGLSDREIDEWLLANVYDTAHLSCGARMGSTADPKAVVDVRGAVFGTEALWVADMSVVPTVPRANTHLTAVMIGERLAALLTFDGENVDDPVDEDVDTL